MADKVGRKTNLDEELVREIKQSILDGNDLKTTANICEIPESTLYTWHSDNYLNIADKILNWKHERMLKLAEMNLEGIMGLGISDKDSLKVVADVSKFVSETLGKKNYSKRSELTGEDGKEIQSITAINYITPDGNHIKTNDKAERSISSTSE